MTVCSGECLEGPNKVDIPFLAHEGLVIGMILVAGAHQILDPVQWPNALPYEKALKMKKAL